MSLEDVLAKLQKTYITNIPEKLKHMKTHIDAKDYKSLREEFHKIKGTGRTYGIPEITDLGAVFEEILIVSDFKPQINWALDAYDLFKDIYTSRSKDKAFNIAQDPRYRNLMSTLQSFKKPG
jgi:HPt (histidine-containing phosphotransfer) domain-containing protein